jgi:hypothetical protein
MLSLQHFRLHFLLLAIFFLRLFGPIFHPISVFAWLWFTIIIFYTRSLDRQRVLWIILLLATFSVATTLAQLGTMNSGDGRILPSRGAMVFGLCSVGSGLAGLSFVMDRMAQLRFTWAKHVAFAFTWTGKRVVRNKYKN